MRVIYLVIITYFLGFYYVQASSQEIRHIQPTSTRDTRNQYFIELLNLALSKTVESHGPYNLVPALSKMTQSRAFPSLGRQLDVVCSMTSIERETLFTPIRIPLLKGLLGHRIFIIRNREEKRFEDINSLEQLREFVAGQGHDWPDTQILRSNGLKVQTSTSYESLFMMLKKRRFDYFPRGVNEPFEELATRPEFDLTVEPHLLIRYPAPIFYFTSASTKSSFTTQGNR